MAGDRKEYITAFLIGAIVGAGATVLLSAGSEKKQRFYQLEPGVRRLRKRGRRLRKSLRNRW